MENPRKQHTLLLNVKNKNKNKNAEDMFWEAKRVILKLDVLMYTFNPSRIEFCLFKDE
jgi:hypothetical protein